jgi:hypothetical protein
MKKLILAIALVALLVGCATPLVRINGGAATRSVVISVEPADAKVFLDGKYIGRAEKFSAAEGGLPLTAGAHRLRFEAEEFLNEMVVVSAGVTNEPVVIRMLPRPEAPEDKE